MQTRRLAQAILVLAALSCALALGACDRLDAEPAAWETIVSRPRPAPSPTPAPNAPAQTDTAEAATETPAAGAIASPAPAATAPPALDVGAASNPPPDRDLYALAHRLDGIPKDTPRTLLVPRAERQAGHSETFSITDLDDDTTHTITATLGIVSENAYWYVEDGLSIDMADLERAAEAYEGLVRPVLLEAMGDVWNPGVDGDPRLTVLHARLGGNTAGYFDARSEYPRLVQEQSNEREMLFMDGETLRTGSDDYVGVLAHELQHAIHWAYDRGEESWVNEGLSEAAADLVGNAPNFVNAFLSNPATQLTHWRQGSESPPHYGAASLFAIYLLEHYGGDDGLRELVAQPLDGIDGVNAFLKPKSTTFDEVYLDWIVANYLDADSGVYGYADHDVRVSRIDRINRLGSRTGHLAPYSTRYFRLGDLPSDVVIELTGDTSTRQAASGCHSGERCWWGNRGDAIDATLTREFDLSGVESATLEFATWHDIEEDWDYAYVEVSDDGGQTWTILASDDTTDTNPVGNSYGHGFTGHSGGWLPQSVDLTPYAGSKLLIRFEYVTDSAIHKDGFLIDDIAIPEAGFFDDAETAAGWDAMGFERIDNVVPVEFAAVVIERRRDGSDAARRMDIVDGRGQIAVIGLGDEVVEAVLAVSPLAPNTSRLAGFTLETREAP